MLSLPPQAGKHTRHVLLLIHHLLRQRYYLLPVAQRFRPKSGFAFSALGSHPSERPWKGALKPIIITGGRGLDRILRHISHPATAGARLSNKFRSRTSCRTPVGGRGRLAIGRAHSTLKLAMLRPASQPACPPARVTHCQRFDHGRVFLTTSKVQPRTGSPLHRGSDKFITFLLQSATVTPA